MTGKEFNIGDVVTVLPPPKDLNERRMGAGYFEHMHVHVGNDFVIKDFMHGCGYLLSNDFWYLPQWIEIKNQSTILW